MNMLNFWKVLRYNLVCGSLHLINNKPVYEKRKLFQNQVMQI
jgi:hypothetical protein